MVVTPRQLNRSTLARQLLVERQAIDVGEAVHRSVALQAQEPASPYVALWNRVAGFDPADLDAAFVRRDIVKASLMRITLHVVHAADYPAFHQAMVPNLRAARVHDKRFRSTGLSVDEADELVPHIVDFVAERRTKAEIEALLADRLGGSPDQYVWWALRTFAPVIHAPTGDVWSFGRRPSYMAAPTDPPPPDRPSSLGWLVRRYLEGFGPATPEDFAQFALHTRTAARAAFEAMHDELVTSEGPDGIVLYDLPDAELPPDDLPVPPRLMAMWDSTLLAYRDRSRVIPDEYRPMVIRRNGDVLATLLVDGHVAGVWRTVDEGIEATAFQPLSDDVWAHLASEARGLVAFLSVREPLVYSRFGRWWQHLEGAETRILPG